jgi:hypothetical protein
LEERRGGKMKQDKINNLDWNFKTHTGATIAIDNQKRCIYCGLPIRVAKKTICDLCQWKKKRGQL